MENCWLGLITPMDQVALEWTVLYTIANLIPAAAPFILPDQSKQMEDVIY